MLLSNFYSDSLFAQHLRVLLFAGKQEGFQFSCPVRDGELPGLAGKTESEYIAEQLGRPVVKVFNNLVEYTLRHKGKAAGEEGGVAISVDEINALNRLVSAWRGD